MPLPNDNILICTQCVLHRYRTQVVPGEGNSSATLAFVGEAPGKIEDETGHPFAGPAGGRFDAQLAKAGLKREDVWIDNTIHCRPPDNAIANYPDAVVRCPDLWLYPQLDSLPNLRVVVALGATSTSLWFGSASKISQLVGLARNYEGKYLVLPAFHPAAAGYKGGKWNDIDDVNVGVMLRALTYVATLGGG